METTLFIVRHGHREDSKGQAPDSRPCDPDITHDIGVKQAKETGQRLKGEGLSVVYASPFLRATHTGALIARECGVRLRLDWGLGEWFCGRWWKAWPGTIHPEILASMFPEIEPSEPTGFYPVLNESQGWVVRRYHETAKALCERHEGSKIAIVTHGLAIIYLPEVLTGNILKDDPYHHRLCGVTKMALSGKKWNAEYLNDVSHLSFVET